MSKDKPRLVPGLVIGQLGTASDKNLCVFPAARYKMYNEQGKEVNGVWSRTHRNGPFFVNFQWDAVEIAKFIDPETAKIGVRYEWREGEYAERYTERLYLVLNIKHVLNGGKPILKHAPGGKETQEWIKKLEEWVKKHSEFSKKVLGRAKMLLTTEMHCATGFSVHS